MASFRTTVGEIFYHDIVEKRGKNPFRIAPRGDRAGWCRRLRHRADGTEGAAIVIPVRTLVYGDQSRIGHDSRHQTRVAHTCGSVTHNTPPGRALPSVLVTVLIFAGLWFLGPALGGAPPFGRNLGVAGPILGVLVALLGLAGLLATGIRGNRWAFLGVSFVAWYSIYGIKVGKGAEFWPFRGWGYESLSVFDRSWAFWYTVLYTTLMTVFGLAALKRWDLDRRDKFQIWRFTSLLGFQWICFFIIPEFLFQWAVQYRWVGEGLAVDPNFADQAWRSYGIVYAWPLFF